MQLIIDIDLQEVVQDFGSRQIVPNVQCKSQDTPKLDIYFVQRGNVLDLGSGPGLRFGVFDPSGLNPNPLVQTTTFTKQTDFNNRTYYEGLPNFYTTAMAAAIGSAKTYAAVGEVRFQDGQAIERTIDVPFTILKSYLSETVLDTTQVAFTVPAVGSNVTIQITNTNWLAPGLNLAIGSGAGAYQVVSITDATHFVAKNQGGTGNAAAGVVIPSGATVGDAPAALVPTYPDPSILELTTRKDQASGYAGLNSSKFLNGHEIPIDGSSIVLNGSGQLQSTTVGQAGQNAYTTILTSFTTPAVGASVQINVGSTVWMAPTGYVIFIAGAGYYGTNGVVDAQHINVTNLGYPTTNANPGTTIPAAALVTPGAPQGLAGANGANGSPGANAYDTVQAAFTVPAVNASVNITITNTGWLTTGAEVFIGSGGGYYNVQSITSLTVFSAKNIGLAGNAAPGATIAIGTQIVPAGVPGPAGPAGSGSGDMLKSVYDPNNNGVVDTCDALAWGKLTSVPVTFPPTLSDAELTAGVTLLGTLTGQIKRIIPGANVTLDTTTTPGGVIINGAAAGGGGGIAEAPTDGNTYARKMAAWIILPPLSDAETTSGLTLLGSSTGQIKRLIAGSNVTLDAATTPGGVIVNSTASGGGGGVGQGYWDPSNGLYFKDDFNLAGAAGPINDPQYALSNGTGATFVGSSAYGQNSTLKVLGAVELNTGTNASSTGAAMTWGGLIAPDYGSIVYNLGTALTFKTRIFLETALPATGGGYAFRTGIGRGSGTMYFNPPVQGFYFEYSPDNNSGQWRVAVGGASPTYTNTSTAVVADTAYALEIDVNAAWSSIAFLINGTTVATISSGIPTTFGFPFWQYAKGSAGTVAQKAAVDSWMIYYPVAR